MQVGADVEAQGLMKMAHLNGLKGKLIKIDGEMHQVQFGAPHGLLQLKAANLKVAGAGGGAAGAPGAAEFPPGTDVEAHSLVSQQQLNGAKGKVTEVRPAPDGTPTFVTQFGPPHGTLALRAKNLKRVGAPTPAAAAPAAAAGGAGPLPVGSDVEAHSLVSMAKLNGVRGKVTEHRPGPDGATQHVVAFGPPHGTLMLKAANLRPAPGAAGAAPPPGAPASGGSPPLAVGMAVEAHSLVSQAKLNGARGSVTELRNAPDGSQLFVVAFGPEHGTLALRATNLKPAGAPGAPGAPAAPPPAAAGAAGFPIGSTVEAQGLVAMAALNGKQGKVTQHRKAPDGSDQIVVEFPPPNGVMAMRAANLKPAGAPGSLFSSPASSPSPFSPPGSPPPAFGGAAGAPPFGAAADSRDNAMMLASMLGRGPPPRPRAAMEGFLEKKTDAPGRAADTRYYILKGNTLYYYEEKGRLRIGPDSTVQSMGKAYSFKVKAKKLEGQTPTGKAKEYELKATADQIRQAWIAALTAAKMGQPPPEPGNPVKEVQAWELADRNRVDADYFAELPRRPAAGAPAAAAAGAPPPSSGGDAAAAAKAKAAEEKAEALQKKITELEAAASGDTTALQARVDSLTKQLEEAQKPGGGGGEGAAAGGDAEARAQALQKRVAELEAAAAAGTAAAATAAAAPPPADLGDAQRRTKEAEEKAAVLARRVEELQAGAGSAALPPGPAAEAAVRAETLQRAAEARADGLQRRVAELEGGRSIGAGPLAGGADVATLQLRVADLEKQLALAHAAPSEASQLKQQVTYLQQQLSQAAQDMDALRRQFGRQLALQGGAVLPAAGSPPPPVSYGGAGAYDAAAYQQAQRRVAQAEGEREAWRRRAVEAEAAAARAASSARSAERWRGDAAASPPRDRLSPQAPLSPPAAGVGVATVALHPSPPVSPTAAYHHVDADGVATYAFAGAGPVSPPRPAVGGAAVAWAGLPMLPPSSAFVLAD